MPELHANYCFFHRAKNLICKACTQPICLFRDLNEREFPKLSCDFCFLLSIPSVAKL